MPHTGVDKHAWSATAETIHLIARTRKIVAIFQVNRQGTIRIRARLTFTTIRHTRRITMVVSRAPPPILPPLLLLECALEPPKTRAKILARQPGTFRNATDSSNAVRYRRQNLREAPRLVSEAARVLLLARPITQHRLPLSRAHGLLLRLHTIFTP